jgi:hypothetical protein
MKKITQKEIKKELTKIINKDQIEEVLYEPRYSELKKFSYETGYDRTLIGSIITIRTLSFPYKRG